MATSARPLTNGRHKSIGSQSSVDGQLPSVAEEGGTDENSRDVVVIAVNSSERSEHAFDWYVNKVHDADNQVLVIYVVEQPSLNSPTNSGEALNVVSNPKAMRKLSIDNNRTEAVRENYEQKMKAAHFGASSRFMTFHSPRPGEMIVSVATEHDADYIVLGTRGLSRLRLTLSNSGSSVSEHVTLNAHCPVIVCRNTK